MSDKTIRPHGLWESPISPRGLSVDKRLSEVQWDSDGQTLVWLEGRSDRGVLVAQQIGDGAPRDLTSELSVRAEVGYGGGDFTVHGGQAFFAAHKQGALYRQSLAGGQPQAITPAFGKAAAPAVSPDGRMVAYVHHDDAQVDRIAIVDALGQQWPQVLTSGHDFYMQPRFSPDGKWFCWVAWDHPNMPWDGTLLYLAELTADGGALSHLRSPRVVAGGDQVAIFQPEFTPDGKSLVFVSDETGFGRLAVLELASGTRRWLTGEGDEYFRPAWQQGARVYAITADSRSIIAARNDQGVDRVEKIDIASGARQTIEALTQYTDASQMAAAPRGARIAMIASAARIPPRIVELDLAADGAHIAARASGEMVPRAALADCRAISWKTAGDETAYGIYYAPHSDRFEAASGKPPLVVLVHGGPTGQTKAAWSPTAQFFATRGYAVLSVNYRGSTGYGRQYMLRLRGNWGVCDVEDCTSGARHLAEQGLIDPARTAIMGGSAGGFTVLHTMVTEPEAFTVGISMYGVANQFSLAADTHKFEARYLDTMLGPLPEAAAVYRERSPVYHAKRIKRPLAIFQGDIDQVVPREQSDSIVEALRRNGTPNVYHVYEGEGHGWRKTETIVHFYQAVDDFLRKHLLFA
jgi:dipeptidyl aminopeptidase/acylaminoacyl peptidase